MKRVFPDSHFFIALLNRKDAAHIRAMQAGADQTLRLVTTRWVLAEVADAMSSVEHRPNAVQFLRLATANPWLKILDGSDELFEEGFELYANRLDKNWSLTDCISFAVMKREDLVDALTGDHHFFQAGFTALLVDK